MQELLQHIISPFIASPDEVEVDIQEGDASQIITLQLGDADKAVLKANNEEVLHNVRHILSIASGSKKAVLRLRETGSNEARASSEDSATADEDSPF